MCSIAGFITKNSLRPDTAHLLTNALLFYGSERGDQSCGVMVDGKILKRALPNHKFRELDEYKNLFTENVHHALIHTRQPTCGGLGDAQAQPFQIGNTTTIHNGWINQTDQVMRKWNIRKKSGVDSQLITSFIHSYGIRKLTSFVKSSSGTSAIAAIHYGELYLFRSGNPMFYTFIDTDDDDTIFVFASTEEILGNALRYIFLLDAEHPIKELKEGVLFHINTSRIAKMSEKAEHKRMFFPSRQRGYFQGHWWDDEDYIRSQAGKAVIISREEPKLYDEDQEKPEDIKYFEPNKEIISTD